MLLARFRPALAVLVMAGALAWPGSVAASVNHHPIHLHQLPANPNTPAFVFGVKGGFSDAGPFTVTVYGSGRVKLVSARSPGPYHLLNPNIRISPDALAGLLRLAKAEQFFSMPVLTVAHDVKSEAATVFITVITADRSKTVSVRGARPAPFYQLYSVLAYVAALSA